MLLIYRLIIDTGVDNEKVTRVGQPVMSCCNEMMRTESEGWVQERPEEREGRYKYK